KTAYEMLLPKFNLKPRKEPKKVLADIELIFDQIHKVKGFVLVASTLGTSDGYHLVAPKKQVTTGRPFWYYWCDDKQLWGRLEEAVIKKYLDLTFPDNVSTTGTI
ncbi:MAG TPA: hypothetical protein DIS62_00370, partial [Candidatus Kerfeldbacteria bacterium]|nr:hypothetical protein [Candidatus Kerfeldbacteria bacterium]